MAPLTNEDKILTKRH